jgi:hypoxanthine-DNA glycosylase
VASAISGGNTRAPLTALPPVLREDTRLLILGSFPGAASLAARQYYAHPRNQFWPILGRMLGNPLPEQPYEDRIRCLLNHRIGLWDVYASCFREGASTRRSAMRFPMTWPSSGRGPRDFAW